MLNNVIRKKAKKNANNDRNQEKTPVFLHFSFRFHAYFFLARFLKAY